MTTKTNPEHIDKALALVRVAVMEAIELHEPFPTMFHGKAVIEEELDELLLLELLLEESLELWELFKEELLLEPELEVE